MWQSTCDMWHSTCDMSHSTCGIGILPVILTCDMLPVTCDIPPVPLTFYLWYSCDIWHFTCDILHNWQLPVIFHPWLVTFDMPPVSWHFTCDMWRDIPPVTFYIQSVTFTCDMWHLPVTCDIPPMTCDILPVTCYLWHVTFHLWTCYLWRDIQPVTFKILPVRCGIPVIFDIPFVTFYIITDSTHYMWHSTCDICHSICVPSWNISSCASTTPEI